MYERMCFLIEISIMHSPRTHTHTHYLARVLLFLFIFSIVYSRAVLHVCVCVQNWARAHAAEKKARDSMAKTPVYKHIDKLCSQLFSVSIAKTCQFSHRTLAIALAFCAAFDGDAKPAQPWNSFYYIGSCLACCLCVHFLLHATQQILCRFYN